MDLWCRSDITFQRMEGLIRRGLLHAWTLAEEWLLPGEEDVSSLPYGYVILFAHFHERGFATLLTYFFGGCCTITRSSCSTSIPTESSTWWRSSTYVRDS